MSARTSKLDYRGARGFSLHEVMVLPSMVGGSVRPWIGMIDYARLGAELSQGPKVGGDQVWAYNGGNLGRENVMPPTSNWKARKITLRT